jgi:hypothetical protein
MTIADPCPRLSHEPGRISIVTKRYQVHRPRAPKTGLLKKIISMQNLKRLMIAIEIIWRNKYGVWDYYAEVGSSVAM